MSKAKSTPKQANSKLVSIEMPAVGPTDGNEIYDVDIFPRTKVSTILSDPKLPLKGYELRLKGKAEVLKPETDLYNLVESGTKLQAFAFVSVG